MPGTLLSMLLLSTLAGGPAGVQAAETTGEEPRVELRLVEAGAGELALVFDIEEGWHIYWHNPGDSGMATTARLQPGDAAPRFPGPQRFVSEEGNLVTYGYSGRTALFFTAPKDREELVPRAEARWLVCRERCVLQEGKARLSQDELSGLDSLRRQLPRGVSPDISYRGRTAVVALTGGPFELFPPVALEEGLEAFRITPTGLELDLKPGSGPDLPVVLKAHDGDFVTFDLPPPPLTEK
ncbi:MAG: protein-disulfide reductase DsbD domain-containing protein [Myxococcota bacterium]|nr:protein-disulfide reductase DsbD domain-containing protein [Myxococcota bacterium]